MIRGLKLRGKFILITLIGIAFVLLVNFIVYIFIGKVERRAEKLYNDRLLSMKWAGEARLNFHLVERNTKELLLAVDAQEMANLKRDINKLIFRNDELLETIRTGNMDAYQEDLLRKIKEETDIYRPERKKVEIMAATGSDKEVYKYFQQYAKPHLDEITKQYNTLIDYNTKLLQDQLVVIRNNKVRVDCILISTILISILLAIVLFRIANKAFCELQSSAKIRL